MTNDPFLTGLDQLAEVWRERAEELHADGHAVEAGLLERLQSDVRQALATAAPSADIALARDRLWTQPEAAYYLCVSTRYLRESTCPKVLLPGTGKKGQSLVRYEPAVVEKWKDAWLTRSIRRAS